MRLIDADVLLEKVREIRKLALDRAVETPANMPFPIYQNPAYTRYSTQADEREKFKVMIDDAPTVQPEQRWIPVTERLPEIDKEVLVTDGKLCWVCSLFESQDAEDGLYQWEDNYGHWHEFETWVAWMPLPGPWKGEEDATD